ncbi:MAG TPA: hypothetical protein VHE53_02810 [Patescibacteria group bacterium]|nr:hypothetical protein [Patescibacteria group bacterium]
MSSKTPVQRFVSEFAEKPLKAMGEEVKRQAVGVKDDLYQQLTGKTNLSDNEISQMGADYAKSDSQDIDYITRELRMMREGKPSSPQQRHNTQERRQANRRIRMEHHSAQTNDRPQGPTNQEADRQRLADQQTELVNKTLARRNQLSESFSVPEGKRTGMLGKRQRSSTRMQAPPKTSENKAGRGGRE